MLQNLNQDLLILITTILNRLVSLPPQNVGVCHAPRQNTTKQGINISDDVNPWDCQRALATGVLKGNLPGLGNFPLNTLAVLLIIGKRVWKAV